MTPDRTNRSDATSSDAPGELPTDGSGHRPGEGILGGTLSNVVPSTDVEDADPPRAVELGGSIGVGLGVLSLLLAVVGVTAAWLEIQPLGTVSVAFSLITIAISMVLGLVYQFAIMQL